MSKVQIGKIDWTSLAASLGTIQKNGEQGGTSEGRKALELILGEKNIRLAVDHYLDGKQGLLLVRNVLEVIRPSSAMYYCLRVYQESNEQDRKYQSLMLLKAFADNRILPWLEDILNDEDPTIQKLGSDLLEQLIWSDAVEVSDCKALILKMKTHENEEVRKVYSCILETLKEREEKV